MNALIFDPFAGISGDMTLGAFADLGVPTGIMIDSVNSLNLPGCGLSFSRIVKKGIACHKAEIEEGDSKPLRHLPDIELIVKNANLSKEVEADALKILRRMGEAEARVHNQPLENIHFHEIGAVDTIVDVVANVAAFHYLKPERVFTKPVRWGAGNVEISHGIYPLPAPATTLLLGEIPGFHGEFVKEWTTPTGAALLHHFVTDIHLPGSFSIEKVGYGAGNRDHERLANVLRIMTGTVDSAFRDGVIQIETQVDDCTGEDLGHLQKLLSESEALDWFFTPVQMKKNRPGVLITVMCRQHNFTALEQLLLKNTSSIGLRHFSVDRTELSRRIVTLDTPLGSVRYKLAELSGTLYNCAPEHEDCGRIAGETGESLMETRRKLLEFYYQNQNE
jgi:uncharacterized protein (TIGR00299 family) protein